MGKKYGVKREFAIYNYDSRMAATNRMINSELSAANSELITRYDRLMVSEGLAKATRSRTLQLLLGMTRITGKDWKDISRDDVEALVAKVHDRYADSTGKETNTTYDHKKVLKSFVRWIRLGSRSCAKVGDPPETAGIKMRRVEDRISRESLLTEDDLTRLLHVCRGNQRDRAFIDCQYEAGTRPGEILSICIKHVKFDEHGAMINVTGKTGARPIRLIRSVPNLSQWINSHPYRDNPDAPVWIDISAKHNTKPMSYFAAHAMVKRRCKQANITKRIYLNLFRHSEATATAQYLTEAQMRKRHGWNAASKMPSRYVHLVNADVDRAVLEHHGIIKEVKKTERLPRRCQVCDTSNPTESELCHKCGKPLDLGTAVRMEEESSSELTETRRQLDEVMAQSRRHEKMLEMQSDMLRKISSKLV